jgi:hypothetical protein
MKKFIVIAFILFFAAFANAQEPLFVKNDKIINVGLGLDSYPVGSLSLDYCIADGIGDLGSIGVGPYAGLGFYWGGGMVIKAGARGTFHYPIIDKLDTYAGIGMGFSYHTYRYWANYINLSPGFFLGGRYLFNESLSLFAEVGYGVSYITAGIAFKF